MAWAAIGAAAVTTVGGAILGGGGGGGAAPPPPDPMIGESARLNLDAAKVGFSNGADIMARYKSMYQPVEDRVIADANNIDSIENLNRAAGDAASGVQTQFDSALGQGSRRLASLGINPNSGKSIALGKDAELGVAAAKADAANKAISDAKSKGMAARIAVAGIGNGVAQLANQTSQIAAAGANSAGAVLNSQYGTSASATSDANALNAKADEGLGKMLGAVGSAAAPAIVDWAKK